jgi:hypothetical protein
MKHGSNFLLLAEQIITASGNSLWLYVIDKKTITGMFFPLWFLPDSERVNSFEHIKPVLHKLNRNLYNRS